MRAALSASPSATTRRPRRGYRPPPRRAGEERLEIDWNEPGLSESASTAAARSPRPNQYACQRTPRSATAAGDRGLGERLHVARLMGTAWRSRSTRPGGPSPRPQEALRLRERGVGLSGARHAYACQAAAATSGARPASSRSGRGRGAPELQSRGSDATSRPPRAQERRCDAEEERAAERAAAVATREQQDGLRHQRRRAPSRPGTRGAARRSRGRATSARDRRLRRAAGMRRRPGRGRGRHARHVCGGGGAEGDQRGADQPVRPEPEERGPEREERPLARDVVRVAPLGDPPIPGGIPRAERPEEAFTDDAGHAARRPARDRAGQDERRDERDDAGRPGRPDGQPCAGGGCRRGSTAHAG